MFNDKYGLRKSKNSNKGFLIKDEENLQIFPLLSNKPKTDEPTNNSSTNNNKNNNNNKKYFSKDFLLLKFRGNKMPEIGVDDFSKHTTAPVPPARRKLPGIPMMDASSTEDNGNEIDLGYCESEDNYTRLSFANFDKKYSMGGVHGRRQDVAPENPLNLHKYSSSSSNTSSTLNSKCCCCCGLIRVETGALIIAFLELCFILYQMFSASIAYDKTGDENAFAFTLTLFSFILAIIAVILLLVGVYKRSPYFLVPHLLMQFAIFASAFALCIYFILLLIGGTSVTIDTIFYEDSTRGELGLSKSGRITPIKKKILTHGLNTIFIGLAISALLFFFAQVWFFLIMRRCYKIFYNSSIEKKSAIVNAASMPTPTTTQTTAVDILGQTQQHQHRDIQSQQQRNNYSSRSKNHGNQNIRQRV